MQGETYSKWRTQDFKLFKGGSTWRPPPINPYEETVSDNEPEKETAKPDVAPKPEETKVKRPELRDE